MTCGKKKDHQHSNLFYSETLYELTKMFISGIYGTVLNRKNRLQRTMSQNSKYYRKKLNIIPAGKLTHYLGSCHWIRISLLLIQNMAAWTCDSTDQTRFLFVWFWYYFSQLSGYRYQYQWVEKNPLKSWCNMQKTKFIQNPLEHNQSWRVIRSSMR